MIFLHYLHDETVHANFASDTIFLKYTVVLVCCSKKYDFNKETFILLNVENESSFVHSVRYYRQVLMVANKI